MTAPKLSVVLSRDYLRVPLVLSDDASTVAPQRD